MTADELRRHVKAAENIIGPVLREDGSTALLKIDREEVITELENYAGETGPAPWEIDEIDFENRDLILKASRPAPKTGETVLSLGGARYRCASIDGDTVVFKKLGDD